MKNLRLKILFIILVVVIVYLPAATSGEVNTVDDVHIFNAYGINSHYTLKQILLPSGKFYYRPVIELSFFFDNLLWGLNPSAMHLENVIIHLVNVILVFMVASRISILGESHAELPLVSSLLFALHPVNTESISWIAGRTDALATMFVLVAIYSLLKERHRADIVVTIIAVLLAISCKETALILLPVMFFMYYSIPCVDDSRTRSLIEPSWRRGFSMTFAGLSGVVFLFIAGQIYNKQDNVFSFIFQLRSFDLVQSLFVLFRTLGFYVKKFFFPFPLNFAIVDVSDYYSLFGVIIIFFACWLSFKRNLLNAFLLSGIAFVVPALVVTLTKFNWTPVAERYLYLPSAFLSIGFGGYLLKFICRFRKESWIVPGISLLALPLGGLTMERNIIWRDNLVLFQDTVRKSPDFGDIRNELGVALMRRGHDEEAKQHLSIAEKTARRELIRVFAGLNLLWIEMKGKSPVERRQILLSALDRNANSHPDLLRLLRSTDMDILREENDKEKRAVLFRELISLNDRLFAIASDPFYLYHSGQMHLALGEHKQALEYYRHTVSVAPDDAYYRQPAQKMIDKFGRK